jgi:hypothetical protein
MSFPNSNAHAGGASASASAPVSDSYSSAGTGAGSDNVLVIKTVQIAPIRTLMCALKEILIETNITFQKDGMRIINMDKSHTMLAHMFLEAVNFELYECALDKIIIGVNMFHLFKLINSIDNDDTLTIYIEKKDYNDVLRFSEDYPRSLVYFRETGD